jgi:hypothetical protein
MFFFSFFILKNLVKFNPKKNLAKLVKITLEKHFFPKQNSISLSKNSQIFPEKNHGL